MKNLKSLGLVIFISLVLFSCATKIQQDIIVSSDLYLQDSDLASIEEKFAKLDADFIEYHIVDQETLSELNKMVDKSLKEVEIKNALKARLFAIKGRIYLLENKRQKALEFYKKAEESYKGDAISIVLGNRLGEIDSLEEAEKKVFGKTEKALITLEKAILKYVDKSYTEAVSLFDETFIILPHFYKEAYGPIRNNAWDFRNIGDISENDRISKLLNEPYITVEEMLEIAQHSSSSLISITGGKYYSKTELYKKVLSFGVLTSVNKEQTCNATDYVTRGTVARFLWNLYCNKKGLKADIYSQSFLGLIESPVLDVPINHSDFDAILGCVEREYIDLIDGINFFPDEKISGIEFYELIKGF